MGLKTWLTATNKGKEGWKHVVDGRNVVTEVIAMKLVYNEIFEIYETIDIQDFIEILEMD